MNQIPNKVFFIKKPKELTESSTTIGSNYSSSDSKIRTSFEPSEIQKIITKNIPFTEHRQQFENFREKTSEHFKASNNESSEDECTTPGIIDERISAINEFRVNNMKECVSRVNISRKNLQNQVCLHTYRLNNRMLPERVYYNDVAAQDRDLYCSRKSLLINARVASENTVVAASSSMSPILVLNVDEDHLSKTDHRVKNKASGCRKTKNTNVAKTVEQIQLPVNSLALRYQKRMF